MKRKTHTSRAKKAGMPPGSLVYVGDESPRGTRMTLIDYDEQQVTEREIKRVEDCLQFKDRASVTWINVDGINEPALMQDFGRLLGFHPLMLEDILNTDQRAKVEDHGEHIYVVLKMLEWNKERDEIDVEQLSLVLGPNYAISFQERPGDFFDPLRARIREAVGRARKLGPDFLAYSLLDLIVDQYFVVLDRIGERIEELEELVVTRPRPNTVNLIQKLKREVIFVRKAVWPVKDVIGTLRHLNSPLISKSSAPFLRDLQDHIIQVTEGVDTYQSLVNDTLSIFLSAIGNRTNTVMRVLAVFSAVFMPLTFITGIFGMNFRNMPPLEWGWGFAGTLLGMLLLGFIMVAFFRGKGWL